MSDQPQTIAPRFTISVSPAEDAAVSDAKAVMARIAADFRGLKAQAQEVVVALAAYQPADPILEATNEGRLPASPAYDVSGAALMIVEDAIDRCIELSDRAARVTAETCAEDFQRRQLEGLAADHRRMVRERERREGGAA